MPDYKAAQDVPESEITLPDKNDKAWSAHGASGDGSGSHKFCGHDGRGPTGRELEQQGGNMGKKREP